MVKIEYLGVDITKQLDVGKLYLWKNQRNGYYFSQRKKRGNPSKLEYIELG